jgi:hypothetical protein
MLRRLPEERIDVPKNAKAGRLDGDIVRLFLKKDVYKK